MPPSHGPIRIAYLLQMADTSTENGISKKILGQLIAWNAAGHSCQWFQLNPADRIWPPLAGLPHHAPRRGNPAQRILQSRQLCRDLAAWQPDLIYFRYAYHAPGLPALFRQFPTVAEINSDDRREYALTLSPAKQLYHHFTRSRVLRPISGFVTVTHELTRVLECFSPARITIGNSIPLVSFIPLPEKPASAEPRLLFIGTAGSPWHGLERLSELSVLFPTWRFDVVGLTAPCWERQNSGTSIAPNLHLHGPLPAKDYAALLPQMDVAVGSLAHFKNGMQEACPLKVREYLAHGLPVIGACADTDIPADADYYLRLPNNSAPLAPHRDAIAAFVGHWRTRRVPRSAIAHLDTSVKEAARLAFLERTLATWRSARNCPRPAP